MTKMTKVAQAKQIVEANPNATRSQIVEMFMEQLGMSKAGATTYGYNLAKNAPKRVKADPKMIKSVKVADPEPLVITPEVAMERAEMTAADEVFRDKLAAKRERDAARKREKRAAEKAAKAALAA